MANFSLSNFNKDQYGILLASDQLELAKNVFDKQSQAQQQNQAALVPPDTQNRTILIGLGGTGVKTVDFVKRTVNDTLQPLWKKYIGFLAIDSDSNEYQNAVALTPNEFIPTTRDDVNIRANSPASYPLAWRRFADPERVKNLVALQGNGSGRKRLMGKLKIHDKKLGSPGVDEDIVDRLSNMTTGFAQNLGNGSYDVYVIGSVAGGTCSGGFLEMPALVRKALGNRNINLYAVLFLPDTMINLDPNNKDEMMANGYAALKELNYYEGLTMRDGYSEIFPFNDSNVREIELTSNDGFYTFPYLIGTPTGAAEKGADRVARKKIAEFLISILGKMVSAGEDAHLVSSFVSNAIQKVNDREYADDKETEASGAGHDFPKRYATIGFAQASAPREIIRAYVTGEACKRAGIRSLTPMELNRLRAGGAQIQMPFKGEKELMTAAEGTQKAAELLKPLLDFMNSYKREFFDLNRFSASTYKVTWENVKNNVFDNITFENFVNAEVEKQTGAESMDRLKDEVSRVFREFRAKVKDYVAKEGPFAFCNIANGIFDLRGAQPGSEAGILTMVQRLCAGMNYNSNATVTYPSVSAAKTKLDACKREVVACSGVHPIKNGLGGAKEKTTSNWVQAYNEWINLRINTVRRERVTNINGPGFLNECFLEPTKMLIEQLRTFGYVLEKMAEAYEQMGVSLTDFARFQRLEQDGAEVNIAAVNMKAHEWLFGEAQRIANTVNGLQLRNNLVDSFFESPAKWFEVPDNVVKKANGNVSLTDVERPIPARYAFDECVRKTISINMDASVENLFRQVRQLGVGYEQFAGEIMNDLQAKSMLLINGKVDSKSAYKYIMYPSALQKNDKDIAEAIEHKALEAFGNGIGIYRSDYADKIMLYQMAGPFEIYRLNSLKDWEQQYEGAIRLGNGLHGMSPDVVSKDDGRGNKSYQEMTTWEHYPAIRLLENPKVKDPVTGEISAEGEFRIKMDETLDLARELGVLFSVQDVNGYWSIRRFFCDHTTDDWRFDPDMMMEDKDGLLPIGEKLAIAVAEQNNRRMEDLTRTVALQEGGTLLQPHSTEEIAWKYAYRVLYVHRPMFIQVRETVGQFKVWGEKIKERNGRWLPAKMFKLIQGRVLYPDEQNRWIFTKEDGGRQIIANLSDEVMRTVRRADAKTTAPYDEGLTLYYVYTKLLKSPLADEKIMNDAVARAKDEMIKSPDQELFDESDAFIEETLKKEKKTVEDLEILTDSPRPGEKRRQKKSVLESLDEKNIDADTVDAIADFYNMIERHKKV